MNTNRMNVVVKSKCFLEVFSLPPEFQWQGKYCVTLINIQPSISPGIFTKSNAYFFSLFNIIIIIENFVSEPSPHRFVVSVSEHKKFTNIQKLFYVHFVRSSHYVPAEQCIMSTQTISYPNADLMFIGSLHIFIYLYEWKSQIQISLVVIVIK